MMTDRTKGRLVLFFIYMIAFSLAFWAAASSGYGILLKSAIMVALAVVIIFLGSLDLNNSSVFDPYWSVAPPLMVLFYILAIAFEQPDYAGHFTFADTNVSLTSQPAMANWAYFPRLTIIFLFTLIYSIRLTWNFLRGWPGLKHEDWRYVDFRNNTGKFYWVVSLFGIHLFPALMVFGGTLSIWVAVVHGMKPMGILDIVAILITGFAILLETVSDRQMRIFLKDEGNSGKTMSEGLWGVSRHPNYLGEISFWWGLYLFAVAANPAFWWVIMGPVAITLMFVFASIPMIEKRMMARRPGYAAYKNKVAMLIPWKI